MDALDVDFSILLDNVTIARSRKHITKYYDMSEIGNFPTRLKPKSFYTDIARDEDTISYNDIYSILMNLITSEMPLNTRIMKLDMISSSTKF